jgi:uncharacterized repeat protein (TIGR01451 family)
VRNCVAVCFALSLASGTASAATLTWTITGGIFTDAGVFSGSFVKDAAQERPSNWNITVAGGGAQFPAYNYTPANSVAGLLSYPPNTQPTHLFIDNTPRKRQLRITPSSALDGSVATVPLSRLGSNGHVECFNCAPFRDVISGSFVLTSAAPALTLVSIVPNPVVAGSSVTANISIETVAAFGPPTGTILILDSVNDPKCTMTLPATSCSFAAGAPGGHSLHAMYAGDAHYANASSNALSYTVVPAAVTTVTLSPLAPDPTAVGGTTTATVHVDPVAGYPTPTGVVTVFFFGSGDTTLCTITLPATSCTFAPATGGNQTVSAQYAGDPFYASAFSNQVTMTVAPVPPDITLVSVSPNPTPVGATTTASVTIDVHPSFGPPTGTTTVFDTDGNSLCIITLPANSCSFTPLTAGNLSVVARYDGDANYDTGLSNALPLVVKAPPMIGKAFGAASIPLNGTTTLTFTLTNPTAVALTLTGVSFTDALPPGLVVATPNGLTNACGGTVTAAAGSGTISLVNGSIAASGSCTIVVNVTGIGGGFKNNITSAVTSIEGGTGGTAAASIKVVEPPAIAKAFGAASIVLNGGTTTLTFTLTNPNASLALTGIGFTDALPAGLLVATPSGLTGTCGGTATAVAGSGSIAFVNGGLAAGASCTIAVNIIGTTGGVKDNVTSAVTSAEGGTGGTADAFLVVADPLVIEPPTIAKAFGAASVLVNGITTLTFTLTNPNAATALTAVSFTDALPPGLVVATPNALANTCGGAPAAVAGTGNVNLAGGALPASGACTFTVNVRGTTGGIKNNVTSAVISAEGGPGGSAAATLTVVAAPVIAKAFGASSIAVNGSTSLTFTLTNPNADTALTGVGFTDALPAGLLVATPDGLTSTCGGTVTAIAANVALANGGLASGGSCSIAVNITGSSAGAKNNVTSAITSTEGGVGGTAAASITVVAPPTIVKTFGAATIPLNATTTLTLTLSNPNTAFALTGVGFLDTLHGGIAVAIPNGLTNTCGGTVSAPAGLGRVELVNGLLPAGGSCIVSVDIEGTGAGLEQNVTAAVTSNEGGTGGNGAANITVVAPPLIAKVFGTASVDVGGTTTLRFTLANVNSGTALNGVGVTDVLPAGLVVATPNGLTGSCGGGTITAVAGGTSVSLAAATLAAQSSCVFTVNVAAVAPGSHINTTGAPTSANGGSGTAATAAIIALPSASVAEIPTLSMRVLIAFGMMLAMIGVLGVVRRL